MTVGDGRSRIRGPRVFCVEGFKNMDNASNTSVRTIASNGVGGILVGGDGKALCYSSDNFTTTPAKYSTIIPGVMGVAFDGKRFTAYGRVSMVTSQDGLKWSPKMLPNSIPFENSVSVVRHYIDTSMNT